jgi:bacteriorhodopsin
MRWRDPQRAGLLMWAYFLISLAVGPVIFIRAGTGSPGSAGHASGAIVSAFLAWRVTKGGRVSRTLLIVVAEIAFLATASQIASRFGWLIFGALAAYAVQIALLLSPTVYQRTRQPDWVAPAGWPGSGHR